MPISCGLRLDDEAVRIGVCLRLGLTLCVPHHLRRDSVDVLGLHGCRKLARHHALNELVARAMASADIPFRRKRPDGLSLIPWQAGKPLTWDVTVVCPLADSYVATAA